MRKTPLALSLLLLSLISFANPNQPLPGGTDLSHAPKPPSEVYECRSDAYAIPWIVKIVVSPYSSELNSIAYFDWDNQRYGQAAFSGAEVQLDGNVVNARDLSETDWSLPMNGCFAMKRKSIQISFGPMDTESFEGTFSQFTVLVRNPSNDSPDCSLPKPVMAEPFSLVCRRIH